MDTQNKQVYQHNFEKVDNKSNAIGDELCKIDSKNSNINSSELDNEVPKKPKKKKYCCFGECKKKLTLIDMECKCGFKFCSLHRLPESHNCTYDFKKESKVLLAKTLIKVVHEKVEKI
jgi:predicted nucleic acid binding AN1-type Zn finger protein